MARKFVRVRFDNGSEGSIPEAHAELGGLKPLKRPALNRDGSVAPTKHRTPLGGAASADHITPEARPASDAPKEG